MILKVPYYKQDTSYSCGATTVQMLLKFFGITYSEKTLIEKLKTSKESGVSPQNVKDFLISEGLFCYVNTGSNIPELEYFLSRGLPVMVNFIEPTNEEGHYALVIGTDRDSFILNDPWNGEKFKLFKDEFRSRWSDETGRHEKWMLVASKEDFELGKQFKPTT